MTLGVQKSEWARSMIQRQLPAAIQAHLELFSLEELAAVLTSSIVRTNEPSDQAYAIRSLGTMLIEQSEELQHGGLRP